MITSKMINRRSISSVSDDISKKVSRVPRRFFLVTVAAISIIVFFAILSTLTGTSTSPKASSQHIVIIDAGSSGSRAHVFRYNAANGVVEPQHESLKTKPGLSSYAARPQDAGTR